VDDAMTEMVGVMPASRSEIQAPSARELWERHGEAVCRFAAMVARSDAEAEDIAQGIDQSHPSSSKVDAKGRSRRTTALADRPEHCS